MNAAKTSNGPHGRIPLADDRERFLARLFDRLWETYRRRVSHVASYEKVIAQAGGTFVNDHIAFRTFAVQQPLLGISMLSRLFEALGYVSAGCYQFPDKALSAIHFQHPNGQFPKLFISELQTWKLSPKGRGIILKTAQSHRPPLSDEFLAALAGLASTPTNPAATEVLLDIAARWIEELPWNHPEKQHVLDLNTESQYAAWVLVHGYQVNHFTSLINSHGVAALNDIDSTVAALQAAGIPMKSEIEGAKGTKLRQTATDAARIDVDVLERGVPTKMPWTYAYFELAERGEVTDPESGQRGRFEGFLGPQATNLFEMTRVKG